MRGARAFDPSLRSLSRGADVSLRSSSNTPRWGRAGGAEVSFMGGPVAEATEGSFRGGGRDTSLRVSSIDRPLAVSSTSPGPGPGPPIGINVETSKVSVQEFTSYINQVGRRQCEAGRMLGSSHVYGCEVLCEVLCYTRQVPLPNLAYLFHTVFPPAVPVPCRSGRADEAHLAVPPPHFRHRAGLVDLDAAVCCRKCGDAGQ